MRESEILYASGSSRQAADIDNISLLSKEQLQAELADARLLHKLSIEMIQEDGIAGLYKKIVEAAVTIMNSQYGTIQMLYPEQGSIGKLRILACSGFTPEAEKYWNWVYSDTGSSCGEVLRTGKRVIIPDYRTCAFMKDEPTLQIFLEGGIIAAQSTPLYSRSGKLLGMISTHWNYPHMPSERQFSLLDILARQAADLIERTQTAEALRESEERLRALATATNDVIYSMNPDWTEMYHLDGRDFLSHTSRPDHNWLQKYILPEDRNRVKAVIEKAIQAKKMFQFEHCVLKADGITGWAFSRAIPIMNNEGDIVEWFGAVSDITEKKLMLTRLEGMVDERTRELQRSNEDLQQFAHVASHDLKEPVRKIKTFGLRLRDESGDALNETSRLFTQKILESADRMSTMIEGVLMYSSLTAIDGKKEELDLNNILDEIQNDLEIVMEQKKAEIRCNKLQKIEGVRVLIYQLFYNLINNALKFSKEGEQPVIIIDAQPVSVNGANQIQITVSDNGIGFDPEQSDMIFNTFTRLNPKHKYDGTGLGLSLSRKIVERHNGIIEASGSENGGACFTITLPVKMQA